MSRWFLCSMGASSWTTTRSSTFFRTVGSWRFSRSKAVFWSQTVLLSRPVPCSTVFTPLFLSVFGRFAAVTSRSFVSLDARSSRVSLPWRSWRTAANCARWIFLTVVTWRRMHCWSSSLSTTQSWTSAMCLPWMTWFSPSCRRVASFWLHCALRIALMGLRCRHTSITDAGFEKVLQHCSQLQFLDISNSASLTDATLLHCSTCEHGWPEWGLDTPKLRSIVLDNDMITDLGVSSLLCALPIFSLSVAFCSNITDKSFACIKESSKLEEVNVMWCNKLTDESLRRLQRCRKLTRIGVQGCVLSQPMLHSCQERGVVLF